jgi:hypothetical protein
MRPQTREISIWRSLKPCEWLSQEGMIYWKNPSASLPSAACIWCEMDRLWWDDLLDTYQSRLHTVRLNFDDVYVVTHSAGQIMVNP